MAAAAPPNEQQCEEEIPKMIKSLEIYVEHNRNLYNLYKDESPCLQYYHMQSMAEDTKTIFKIISSLQRKIDVEIRDKIPNMKKLTDTYKIGSYIETIKEIIKNMCDPKIYDKNFKLSEEIENQCNYWKEIYNNLLAILDEKITELLEKVSGAYLRGRNPGNTVGHGGGKRKTVNRRKRKTKKNAKRKTKKNIKRTSNGKRKQIKRKNLNHNKSKSQ